MTAMNHLDAEASSPGIEHQQAALAAYLRQQAQASSVQIDRMQRLSGGAIQENWLLELQLEGGPHAGQQRWVLRTDAPSSVDVSMSREQEFAVLQCAYRAGVKVPQPLALCTDQQILGRDFFLMQALSGNAAGHRLTADDSIEQQRPALCRALGESLANLHSITPPQAELDFLPQPTPDHALACIEAYRNYLDQLDDGYPALEWGLRWCELNKPAPLPSCLLHRDYRTGNYMVDQGLLSGVLDWEFAGWGDPREDIGWFTARCWRFARPDREAGGMGALDDFKAGYNRVAPYPLSDTELIYWQVMAHLRWAIIALQQAERYLTAGEDNLELALTGRMLPELEQEILLLTGAHA